VERYVSRCMTCNKAKSQLNPHGLYMPLPVPSVSYPVFMKKTSTHRMHDPGSIVPHIRLKVFTDNQMSQIKYKYFYINSVSKDYDDSQRN
jgi:hypothetical protein